jgi:predicted nucleic acid-binding protein
MTENRTEATHEPLIVGTLWTALLRGGNTDVLIASVTVLELLRGPKPSAPPVVSGVEFVSFDYKAAYDMSGWATSKVIADVRDASKNTRRVVSYDALIVGTARAHRADCVVAYDTDVKHLASVAGIACHEPSYFRRDATLFSKL